jgi:hypothetical protein
MVDFSRLMGRGNVCLFYKGIMVEKKIYFFVASGGLMV